MPEAGNAAGILIELFKDSLVATSSQAVSSIGVFVLLGIMLHFVSRMIRTCFAGSGMLNLLVFWTGWLGVAVHEGGHIFFCILFGHRIKKVNLFGPDPKTGSLGYVEHSYSRKNIYSRAGNFFIGAAPLVSGAAVLYLSSIFLLPNWSIIENIVNENYKDLKNISSISMYMEYFINNILYLFNHLLMRDNLSNPKFWLFIYISLSTGSHMELSGSDIRSIKEGAGIIIFIMFIVNLFLNASGLGPLKFTSPAAAAYIAGLFLWALLMTIINLILCCVFITLFSLVIRRKMPVFFGKD